MFPEDLRYSVQKRLRSLKGQVQGIEGMLEEDRDPERILEQFRAAREGLANAEKELLDELYRKALAQKIVEANEACPGDCGNEEVIRSLRERFPKMSEAELLESLKGVEDIVADMEKRKKDRGGG